MYLLAIFIIIIFYHLGLNIIAVFINVGFVTHIYKIFYLKLSISMRFSGTHISKIFYLKLSLYIFLLRGDNSAAVVPRYANKFTW